VVPVVGGCKNPSWWNDLSSPSFNEIMDVFDQAEKLALIAEETDASV